MDAYRKEVERYAAQAENYLLHNKGPKHAKIIFENIFRNASHKIRIAANNLWNTEVVNTPEYIDALLNFLNHSESSLDILLTNMPTPDSIIAESGKQNIFKSLFNHRAYSEGRIIIKSGEGKSFKATVGELKEVHFCTADSRMYRYENDIKERLAICNFNDPKTTKHLEELFDVCND